jgi:hypothetical protein
MIIEMNGFNLQLINIPDGWVTKYNKFFDIDPLKIKNDADILWNNFTEDLLQINIKTLFLIWAGILK